MTVAKSQTFAAPLGAEVEQKTLRAVTLRLIPMLAIPT
jgi:hypothetical protein